jgi:alcohol dehydrogenase, propanol-preferring
MLAARLLPGETGLRLVQVPRPEPSGDEVLVRVAGAGVCRSDLHTLDGAFPELVQPPVTMGHEIAGLVEATGPEVRDLAAGTPVVVMVGWGCGHCEWCVSGHEQLCAQGAEAGATADGGFAEFVLVPHRRHVVPLGGLDPVAAAPLGCAGLSAYAAVRRVRPVLAGGSAAVVVGAGGLGQFAIQLLRELTGAQVIAVEADASRRSLALELGASHAVAHGSGAAEAVRSACPSGGTRAVLDFVGTDATLALAADVVAPRGIVALLGLAGGTLRFGFDRLAPEASLTTVFAGTVRDLQELVALAMAGRVSTRVKTYPLASIGKALADLRAGAQVERVVIVP